LNATDQVNAPLENLARGSLSRRSIRLEFNRLATLQHARTIIERIGATPGDGAISSAAPFSERTIMLKFTHNEVSGVLILVFEATDDHAADWQVTQRDWLYKLVESHADPRFAIDLSQVNYLASSEIGFLVSLKRRIDRRQGKVVLFGVGPYIREIFETMNLVRILDIVDNQKSALLKLGTPAAG
jgi:anti-sigma B factor antagonist